MGYSRMRYLCNIITRYSITIAPLLAELAYLARLSTLRLMHTAHCSCASAAELITLPNKLALLISSILKWNLACFTSQRMVDTMMLVLWRYLKYLRCGTHFSFKANYLCFVETSNLFLVQAGFCFFLDDIWIGLYRYYKEKMCLSV